MKRQPKLSLCVIAGNVEKIIGRFLDAFEKVADEVIVVRAIGNQEPDQTLMIAQKHYAVTVAEIYDNEHDWPHVDDFAAARNMACDIATGDWLMWADTDDIITPESIAQIRRLIQDIDDQEVDGVLMRYVIPEDGVINWRERLWRKGSARWENPIHECLRFNPDAKPSIRFEGAEIIHASEKRSASRDERNLRILESIPEDKRTVSQKFHVFQSLIALDRNDEATIKAIEFVGLPDVGRNERYEAFFQLARLAPDSDTKKQMLIQALATDPSRREAFGELGLASLPDDPQAALAWTEAMQALRMPAEAPWNLRRTYYGSLGVSLRAMALRASTRQEEADALETNHFIRNGAKISLLHATRGRPGKAWRTRMDWLRLAENPDSIEHIFGIDADDVSSAMLTVARCCVSHANTGPVGAWNECAKHAKGQVLVQLSDDFEAFQGWDTAILNAFESAHDPLIYKPNDLSMPAVLAVSDGNRSDDLLCMAIITRARYEQQGYLFHPEFFSMFSDNWFSYCAFRDGVVIDARDRITFEHMHPAFGKGENDATYERSNAGLNYVWGKGIFDRLKAGQKVSAEMEGWFDFRDVYDAVSCYLKHNFKFVEVGSWKGKSASYLCDRLHDSGTMGYVMCVDTFKGDDDAGKSDVLAEFRANVHNRLIDWHQMTSIEASTIYADGELDGCFIDAAHDYESVKADIAAWLPKVKTGGFFGGHDIDAPGVLQAVQEAGFPYHIVGRCWIKSDLKP